MDVIFHEKQEGSLCAQHCLNALLQGPYFTPVDLATLAQKLDYEERLRMAENGVDSEDYLRFIEQPSGNYDDSGYFSVQVISSALEVWELELVPYNSTEPRAIEAQKCPAKMKAFICNYRDHWFTIRRLGHQWFNLNSLLSQPELVSDTYLGMFLAQLQTEGYSIFVVFGIFPECEADNLLLLMPAIQREKPRQVVQTIATKDSDEDLDLQRALRLSMGQASEELEDEAIAIKPRVHISSADRSVSSSQDDDLDLQRALCLSLQNESNDSSDEAELEKALQMSLECCDQSPEVNTEDVRRRRLTYLEERNGSQHSEAPSPTSSDRKVRNS